MRRTAVLLLSLYLLGWVPLRYANELLVTYPSLDMRGAPAAIELLLHGGVAVLSATAGWMIWIRAPAAPGLAVAAVVASGAAALQSLFWTSLPHQVAPGAEWPLAVASLLHTLFWLGVIAFGRRDALS